MRSSKRLFIYLILVILFVVSVTKGQKNPDRSRACSSTRNCGTRSTSPSRTGNRNQARNQRPPSGSEPSTASGSRQPCANNNNRTLIIPQPRFYRIPVPLLSPLSQATSSQSRQSGHDLTSTTTQLPPCRQLTVNKEEDEEKDKYFLDAQIPLITSFPALPSNRATRSGSRRSTVSKKTCKADSPAENCFDYFKFAVFWSPGYAYKLMQNRKSIRDDIELKWNIHGLWPSMYSRQDVPSGCARRNFNFNSNRFNGKNILDSLRTKWYTLLDSKDNNVFWKHEFDKHGDCAMRSTAILEFVEYFRKTVSIYDALDLNTLLQTAQLYPGAVTTLGALTSLIELKVGSKVKVNFIYNQITKENYLTEVFVCFNTVLEVMDCPDAYRADFLLKKQITYFNKNPKTNQQIFTISDISSTQTSVGPIIE